VGCLLNDGELVAYHLGDASEAERERVEAHLVDCPACAQAYVKLKCHFEHTPAMRPSDAMRQRLRAEVEVTFRPPLPGRFRSWLGRPIPLYQGVAGALLVAAVVTLFLAAPPVASPRPRTSERVDSARQAAVSHDVF
jgi:anti-sigma factor RsiW